MPSFPQGLNMLSIYSTYTILHMIDIIFIFTLFCIALLRIYVVQYACCNDSPLLASWDFSV